MNQCPNCKAKLPMLHISDIPLLTHIEAQIDVSTGEAFIPVKRIVNNQEVDLWPEDYTCSDIAR